MDKEEIIKKISDLTILIETAREEGSKEEHIRVVNKIMDIIESQKQEIIKMIDNMQEWNDGKYSKYNKALEDVKFKINNPTPKKIRGRERR